MTSLDEKVAARGDAVGFFDESAVDYEGKHYRDGARSFMTVRQWRVMELVARAGLPHGASVLDAGCGPGYLVEALAAKGYRVRAMDAAEGMLRQARARLTAAAPPFAPEFTIGDIEKLPYPDATFDLACSTGVIEYLTGDATVLGEFYRVLKPGGYLVLPVTNVWSPANWLDVVIEPLKRQSWFRSPLNAVRERMGAPPVLPRHFHVRKHRPSAFRDALSAAGFALQDEVYFHFMPLPRPFDRLAPGVSNAIGAQMERFGRGPLGLIGEGYLTLSRRP